MNVRDNWRLVLLVVLIVLSGVALFVPGAPAGSADDGTVSQADATTNLQYGIQLSGGTRIRAPPVGITAEEVAVPITEETALAQSIADRLDVDSIDVRAANETNTVEVFTKDVSESDLRAALEAEGYDPGEIRTGVTEQTLNELVERVDEKLTESALSGGSVQKITLGGRQVVSITAPDRDREELLSILEDRGVVRIYAVTSAANGTYAHTQVLSQDEFARVGTARTNQDGEPGVQVTIDEAVAESFSNEMVELGFGDGSTCTAAAADHDSVETIEGDCMVTTLNGNPVFVGGVELSLGEDFVSGDFAKSPTFTMTTTSMEEARNLELSLKAGRLPAPLDFEQADSLSLSPALADRFKTNSLIVGIMAVLAVSLVVYWRYRRPEVAAPMVVTALSEVFILLGFVAFVQYPLNLSHIAGFIAVIGTGVDDLIIIADEILQQGDVATGRVFQSRFRKAFWVIGAAAATTIVAMSPLTVLSLGDLSGFAIITIVGVLIGVFITRPAYGDILRNLVLARRD
ncbi:MAG: preprotein translocase subunit SecD [Halodesulfurarchaeum sp.]|nr:preprotein translocase subunit SecD [Halodesulfurarchaeum sp.]